MIPVNIQKEDPQSIAKLSKREVQVITLLAEGHTKQKISESLRITKNTVATHVSHIYRKLRVNNTHGAISRAYRCGILTLV